MVGRRSGGSSPAIEAAEIIGKVRCIVSVVLGPFGNHF